MTKEFDLTSDDVFAIQVAKNVARRLLKFPDLSPAEIVGLGHALFALERMPNSTAGVHCEFGIIHKGGDENFNETVYVTFLVSEEMFHIMNGGIVYDRTIGSDSYSRPGWAVETSGYRDTSCDLSCLEEDIEESLNMGARVSVSNESEIGSQLNGEE